MAIEVRKEQRVKVVVTLTEGAELPNEWSGPDVPDVRKWLDKIEEVCADIESEHGPACVDFYPSYVAEIGWSAPETRPERP